jgi:5-methyltetrahydrofolate--homocysteine methyltransferase
MAFDETG